MKNMLCYQILRPTASEKIYNSFKISAPTWNDNSILSDRSYYASDIQYYYEYIIKNYKTLTDNPPIKIHINKIENRVTFTIQIKYFLELLMPENKITKDKNGEIEPHLEITEVILCHYNIGNNDQQDSKVLYILFSYKSYDK